MYEWCDKLGTFWKTPDMGCWLPWELELLPAMQTGNARGDFITTLCGNKEACASSKNPSKTYVLVQPQDAGYRLSEIYVYMMQKVRKDYDNCPLWPWNLSVKFWSCQSQGQNSSWFHWGQTSSCAGWREAKVCATKHPALAGAALLLELLIYTVKKDF